MLLPRLDLRCSMGLVLVAACAGCRPAEQITKYTVTKPEIIDPTLTAVSAPPAASVPTQILGAMIKAGEQQSWFFKLTGDPAAVEPSREAFVSFVKSVTFTPGKNPQPTWKLPSGWEEVPGNAMRLATIKFNSGGEPLEIAISPAGGDTLANVNRWRDQVGLDPIPVTELAKTTETFVVDGRECTFVSLVGTGSGQMSGAPLAPFASGKTTSLPPAAPRSSAGGDLKYEMPKEWTAAPNDPVSIAAFQAVDGDQKVKITISAVGGDLLTNVNRWRQQVSLPPLSLDELAKSVRKIATLGVTGDYVEAIGPGDVTAPETILGVMAAARGQTWFIKLRGDRDLAAREKPRFEAFVKSLQFK
jgi:hypothetical protein